MGLVCDSIYYVNSEDCGTRYAQCNTDSCQMVPTAPTNKTSLVVLNVSTGMTNVVLAYICSHLCPGDSSLKQTLLRLDKTSVSCIKRYNNYLQVVVSEALGSFHVFFMDAT